MNESPQKSMRRNLPLVGITKGTLSKPVAPSKGKHDRVTKGLQKNNKTFWSTGVEQKVNAPPKVQPAKRPSSSPKSLKKQKAQFEK
mmetsp:Transcript_29440/g.44585  ORF Transcript_29440/g.44585 Transcript_29440/m.44585 type:complete len:86 (-) Transcript_29440:359-616(-)